MSTPPEGTNGFDRVVLVHLRIRIWSATAKVHRESDLKAIESQLPPTTLVSDGVKRLLDVSELNPLENVRKSTERELRRVGTPFLDSVAVPESGLAKAEDRLDALRSAFNDARSRVVSNLVELYAQWDAMHPTWAGILAKARPEADEVERRCHFGWTVFKPTSVLGSRCDFSAETQRFIPDLLVDIADQAEQLWKKSFMGRDQVRLGAIAPVRQLVRKLDSFGFLDPRVAPAVTAFDAVLNSLPRQGPLTMTETQMVAGLVLQLANPEQILEHGSATFARQDLQPSLFDADPMDESVPVARAVPAAVFTRPIVNSPPIAVGF